MRAPRLTYRLSRHIVAHTLADGSRAIWNSVFPNVRVIDGEAWGHLKGLPETRHRFTSAELKRLLRARIVFCGDTDPYEAQFFGSVEKAIANIDEVAERFYRERLPYNSLGIVNSGCNLGCSYCVSYYGDEFRTDAARQADKGEARFDAVFNIIDQYLEAKRRHGSRRARLNFNGGEILLRWPLLDRIFDYISTKYPEFRIQAKMNTNATLLTDEIAHKLAKYRVRVSVSVDGYERAHEKTRHYHTGGGSFERVLSGLKRYRSVSGQAMDGFQGTIEDVTNFDEAEMYKMSVHGFDHARLEPNLLHSPEAKGPEAAFWEASLVAASQNKPVTLVNTAFERVLGRMKKGENGFKFNCGGLMGLHPGILNINVDSMQISQMCSFVSPAAVPLSSVGYDIYNPALWTRTRAYILQRLDMLRNACAGCDVQGTCQGSCIYSGLDLNNRMNPAACGFQRAMWRHAIDFAYSGSVRRLSPEEVQSHRLLPASPPNPEPTSRCGSPPPPAPEGKRVWTITQAP
jgi:radical SAM protein with 4Fe4S-binding SPASM domain